MKIKIKESLKRVKEVFIPKEELSEQETVVYRTIQKACSDIDTQYRIAPISQTYFIENPRVHLMIKLNIREIKVKNGVYSYGYTFSANFHESVIEMVEEFIEKDREKFNQQFFREEMDLLKQVELRLEEK